MITLHYCAAFFLCLSKLFQMKLFLFSFLFIVFTFQITHAQKQPAANFNVTDFDLNLNISIRAIAALNDENCWFAGNKGVYGFTEDGGLHWKIDSLKLDTLKPEFRAIAVLDTKTVLLMCIGSPAYILKTIDKGKSWKKVYTNLHEKAFFDAMHFSDKKTGIAVGDPIDSCFSILKTTDGGDNWHVVDCKCIPLAARDEAFFASSNSNIDIVGNNVWIVTGGSTSRILHSADLGENWSVYSTPIISGLPMKGAYTLDFYDNLNGIIAGGDYDNKTNSTANKAITTDGGKSWKLASNTHGPEFISCIQYQPNSNSKTLVACCLPNVYATNDGGLNWTLLWNKVQFYTSRFSPSGKVIWFAGAKGKLGKLVFKG